MFYCFIYMSDLKLYAIELEQKKVFLHVSLPIYEHLLFQECTIMFDFVKKYRPIRILNEIELEDVLKVDYYVKYFMRHYGIDSVRGGSYKDEVLSVEVLKLLDMEIGKTITDYEKDNELYEDVVLHYKIIDVDVAEEITRLNNSLNQYKNKKKLIQLLSIDKSIIADIEWLCEEIKNKRDIYDVPVNTIQKLYSVLHKLPNILALNNPGEFEKYNGVMKKINELIHIYSLLFTQEIAFDYLCSGLRNKFRSIKENQIEITTILKYPHFTLDNIILHPHIINNWSSYNENAVYLMDKITTMAYTVINLLDELAFDLSTFPDDFEKKTQYSIYFLSL